MGLLEGKAALVTGAAAGIGRATALAVAAAGARVTLADVDAAGGAETAAMIRAAGGEAEFVRADVARADEVAALVAAAQRRWGGLQLAVNNAGIEGRVAPLAEQDAADFDRVIAVNLRGTFLCLKAEIPAILAAGGGAIVNLSSVAGQIGFAGLAPYVASKHAVIGLTRNAALEYARQGVRVNAVCPGGVETRMLDSLAAQVSGGTAGTRELLAPMHPIGRIGVPREIADAIVWLLSEQAAFVTGAAIAVDGGYLAQ